MACLQGGVAVPGCIITEKYLCYAAGEAALTEENQLLHNRSVVLPRQQKVAQPGAESFIFLKNSKKNVKVIVLLGAQWYNDLSHRHEVLPGGLWLRRIGSCKGTAHGVVCQAGQRSFLDSLFRIITAFESIRV